MEESEKYLKNFKDKENKISQFIKEVIKFEEKIINLKQEKNKEKNLIEEEYKKLKKPEIIEDYTQIRIEDIEDYDKKKQKKDEKNKRIEEIEKKIKELDKFFDALERIATVLSDAVFVKESL